MIDLALRRLGVIALLLVTGFAFPAAAIDPPPATQTWIRVRVDGYEVFTNLGERKAKELAVSVQRTTSALARALGAQRGSPVRIFVFAKSSEYAPYRDALLGPGTDKTGVCSPSADATYIILDGSSATATPILNHELTHSLLARKRIAVPLWVDEGLAGFYETLEVRRDRVRIGLAHVEHIRALRSAPLLPTRTMLRVTRATDDYKAGAEARRIYAQAWAMVHFLIVGGVSAQTSIPDMIRGIAAGDTLEDAFTKSIGMSVEQFDDALRNYVRQPAFQFVEFRVERDDAAPPAAERLERGRLLAELSEVLVRARYEDARAFSDAALAADPHDARAHSARGYCHLQSGDFDRARAAFAKAQELDPSDESIAAAVKRLEPVLRLAGGPGPATHSEEPRTPSVDEGFRRAMHEATPQEREQLAAALERQNARIAATKRYEEAIALANAQKVDEALRVLEELVDDPAVAQSLRDAAAAIRTEILKQTGRKE